MNNHHLSHETKFDIVWYKLKQRENPPITIMAYGSQNRLFRNDFYAGYSFLAFITYKGGIKNSIEHPNIPPVKFSAYCMYYLKAKLITRTTASIIDDIIAVVLDNF